MNDLTKLFGEKTVGDWKNLRQQIIDNPNDVNNWIKATNLLEMRLNTRYFQPISRILNVPSNKEGSLCSFIDNILSELGLQSSSTKDENIVMALRGEGFAAMTLICSLIEFLQSCYEGRKYKNENNVNNLNLNFEYNRSGKIFKRFFECHQPFKSIFSANVSNPRGKIQTFADDFYYSVRCGLLHEAATNNDWIVRQKTENPNSDEFVNILDENRKIIYRDNFYEEVMKYFEEYKQKIIQDEQATIEINGQDKDIYLRHAFCRKIDFLCEIDGSQEEECPDWWNMDKIYI